ncbi:MAG: repeat-containing protein, partial [Mucilaginibacter sp.]|nr:repeat-containing protein [Mucilaginibacter sp.]
MQRSKKYKEALIEYDSCVTANPGYDKVYLYRGLVKYHLNDLKGSIDDYTKFISTNPKSSMAFDNRGYSKFLMGDNPGALDDYN